MTDHPIIVEPVELPASSVATLREALVNRAADALAGAPVEPADRRRVLDYCRGVMDAVASLDDMCLAATLVRGGAVTE